MNYSWAAGRYCTGKELFSPPVLVVGSFAEMSCVLKVASYRLRIRCKNLNVTLSSPEGHCISSPALYEHVLTPPEIKYAGIPR